MDRRRFLVLTGGSATGLWIAGSGFIALSSHMALALGDGCSFCGRHAHQIDGLAGHTGRSPRICRECVSLFAKGTGLSQVVVSPYYHLLADGNLDALSRDLIAAIERNPTDVRARLKLGDVLAKRGRNADAMREYELIAESYHRDGFYLKSVAVLKQTLMLGDSTAILWRLGDLYMQLGLISDAKLQYVRAANASGITKSMAKEMTTAVGIRFDPKDEEWWIALREAMGRRGVAGDMPGRCSFCEAGTDVFAVSHAAVCRTCNGEAADLFARHSAGTLLA